MTESKTTRGIQNSRSLPEGICGPKADPHRIALGGGVTPEPRLFGGGGRGCAGVTGIGDWRAQAAGALFPDGAEGGGPRVRATHLRIWDFTTIPYPILAQTLTLRKIDGIFECD